MTVQPARSSWSRIALALVSVAALGQAACVTVPAEEEATRPPQLSAEVRRDLRQLGGEQLVADAEFLNSRRRASKADHYVVNQCFSQYVAGLKLDREGATALAVEQFQSCRDWCAKAAELEQKRLSVIGVRYTRRCLQKAGQ